MPAGIVTVLGGTGFVGHCLAKSWPSDGDARLRILVHRSCPSWLEDCRAEIRTVDLENLHDVEKALAGSHVLVDLLRPGGDGWLTTQIRRLLPVLAVVGIERLVHASSIDVYGASPVRLIKEDTAVDPRTPYEREHRDMELLIEQAQQSATILRLGAVFGEGGRNLVALADELAEAPVWRPALRRALYGRRRLHLVSVETVAEAIRFAALPPAARAAKYLLVTDDGADENNFAFVQDRLAAALGRSLPRLPELPPALLRLAMKLRGRSSMYPYRRFSAGGLAELGFRSSRNFVERLERFCTMLAVRRGVTRQ